MTRTPQNNRPLTMREACGLIGWVNDGGEVTQNETRRLRRKLLSAERQRQRRYVFGGTEQGCASWTTPRALAELRLLPEDPGLYADAKQAIGEIHDRLDIICERLDAVAATTVENTTDLHRVKQQVGAR